MLSNIDPGSAAIVLGIGAVSSALYLTVQDIRHERRLRRTGGVRAPTVAKYPGQGNQPVYAVAPRQYTCESSLLPG